MQQPPAVTQVPALARGSILLRRYRIDGYIGGGGFGYIYLAQDLVLGHRRAIKEAFCRDAHAQHQFRLEAEFLLNTRHPNLVGCYAVFEHDNRLYLVMDYVDGHTLEDIAIEHIRRTGRTLPEARVLEWVLPICEAAHTLHSQPVPIIHRDIKPANIKLSASKGIPVLIDLGLAKLYADGTNTIQAALAFTPGYAPPEQYTATGATDQRTDVYGLGASLFYLLTGYQPTEAPARLSAQALPAPRTLNPALSRASEAVVLEAMALDPAERYQSALEMARDMRAALAALQPDILPDIRVEVQHEGAPRMIQPAAVSAPVVSAPAADLWVPCAACGTANPPAARYCMHCAKALGAAAGTSEAPAADAARPAMDRPAPPRRLPARPPGHIAARRAAAVAGRAAPAEWAPVLAGPAAALVRATDRRWPFQGTHPHVHRIAERMLDLGASTLEIEAWTSIGALLALVCVALSLAAISTRALLLFVLPALLLGHLSLAQPADRVPREFRGLAWAAVIASYLWLLVWFVALVTRR